MKITYDRYSLLVDGRREIIRSGAMHYFRLPHPSLWADRLKQLKAAGYNTVDLYFSWDFHSKAPGQYDFTGIRDVKHLLDLVEENGLYLIARPGPYINAETTRGGLPGWLLTQPDVILRNRVEGAYQYSPRYMAYVKEWMDQIVPFFKDRPNLLMVQIENEYCTDEMEPDYMEELKGWMRDYGITAPTMHNDFYAAGLYADIVDIYAVDNYSVTTFDLNWRTFPNLFSVLDHLEAGIREEFCQNRPLMMAELQAGWFAGWKGVSYKTIHESLGRDHIGLVTRSFLGQGGTIFNHYKAVGGTNWDHMGATDAYTSYDFSAPISEQGLPTERLYEAKTINLVLKYFDLSQTQRVPFETVGLTHGDSMYTLRQDVARPDTHWLFTRNLTHQPRSVTVKPGVVIQTKPFQSQIIPINVPLKNGWTLEAINVEPLAQTERCLIVPGASPVAMIIRPAPGESWQTLKLSRPTSLTTQDENTHLLQLTEALAPDQYVRAVLGNTTVYFLGQELADRLWPLSDGNSFVMGPDLVRGDDDMALFTERPCWRIDAQGQAHPLVLPTFTPVTLPPLDQWTLTPEGLPAADDPAFKPLSPQGSDMDSNGIYEGAVWYRYTFTGPAQVMMLHAQHIWGVYLNGYPIVQHQTFHVHPETGGPEDILTLQLPQDHLNTEGQPNELLIFVDSLGHHKGFYDDTREPRGLLSLVLDGKPLPTSQGHLMPLPLTGPRPGKTDTTGPVPILHATTEFRLNLPPNTEAVVGLRLNLDVERVNVILNGVLLGKWWRDCRNQTEYYLPNGILRPDGLNQLTLTCVNLLPPLSVENGFPKAYGEVGLHLFALQVKLSGQTADTCLTS